LRRYQSVARILTGQPDATAEDGVQWVSQLCRQLQIPPLAACGIQDQDVPVLVEAASQASSMKGNPITLTPEELREVLSRALS
jgi:alcohol dehydrogenase class IV